MDKLNDNIKKSKPTSTIDLAKEFLSKQIEKKEFVVDFSKIPNRKVREFLKANDYVYAPCKYIYIINKDTMTHKDLLDHNYFQVVSKL